MGYSEREAWASSIDATQLSLDRVVALKLLAPNLSDDPGFRARFEREGQIQAALDHEHIVTVYEAGQSEYACSSRCG